KIDLSHEHNYSGTLEARLNNLIDYLSIPREAAGKGNQIPADVQATIDSGKWDVRGVIHMPNSSPMSFTANFLLPVGTDWNAFRISPLNITLNFPSVFLAKAPQLFHPEIFNDGILSGNISLSETLQHPHIDGDIQLTNGKMSGDAGGSINLTEASGRIVFGGNRASIEFLNLATNITDPNSVTREFPLCFSSNSLETATLLLGSLPRSEAHPATTPPKKQTKPRYRSPQLAVIITQEI